MNKHFYRSDYPDSSGWLNTCLIYIYYLIISLVQKRSYDSYMGPDLQCGNVKMIFRPFVSIKIRLVFSLKA
jgi:hypothetical protein